MGDDGTAGGDKRAFGRGAYSGGLFNFANDLHFTALGVKALSWGRSGRSPNLWITDGQRRDERVEVSGAYTGGDGLTPHDITALPVPLPPPTGNNDILLQNVSGQAAIWAVNGATLTTSALLGANPGPNWKDVAISHFGADTQPDICCRISMAPL